MLAACERGGEVTIVEDRGIATVSVAETNGEPACIGNLWIYPKDSNTPLWHVAAAPGTPCTSRLVVGREPAGFAADDGTRPPRLALDQSYSVVVSGEGLMATKGLDAGRKVGASG